MKNKNDGFDFLREERETFKQKAKDRRRWAKELEKEYCKARTYKYNRQAEIVHFYRIAGIMEQYYKDIVVVYDDMLKKIELENKEYNKRGK